VDDRMKVEKANVSIQIQNTGKISESTARPIKK